MARKRLTNPNTKRLFRDPSGQRDMFEKSLEEELEAKRRAPIECMGMTFENDEKRREYFLGKLREKLKDPEFRKIEGFPIGKDEDILALSDPPYYTACPNPFIQDFIKQYGKPYDPETDDYRREPFAADVSEGKNDPIYNAHSYHTKVPHKAIMRYVFHYTEPGDLVLDGFCGSGMTGLAATSCADSLSGANKEWQIGLRGSIQCDLSPAATFIAHNYVLNTPSDTVVREAKRVLSELERSCGWMYATTHIDGATQGRINYVTWSDVFLCPECSGEVVFWDNAVDTDTRTIATEFRCPHCLSDINKRNLDRAWVTATDPVLNVIRKCVKRTPVLINYKVGRHNYEKKPSPEDIALIERISSETPSDWIPIRKMMFKDGRWGDQWREGYHTDVTHAHHFFGMRNLKIIARFYDLAHKSAFCSQLIWALTGVLKYAGWMNRISPSSTMGLFRTRSGTLYIGSITGEVNIIDGLRTKLLKTYPKVWSKSFTNMSAISTGSASTLSIPPDSIDYVFVDPPFGSNLAYAELNFLWESWLGVFTNNSKEVIESKAQEKDLSDYLELMAQCFEEFYRVLKPGRWMTVEFHNSKNSVWSAIQEALQRVGFVIADVRTLDKGQGSFNQVVASRAVKQDIIISAYKPNGGLEGRFKLTAGTEEGVWDFVRTHLKHLPVFVSKDGQAEVIAERQNFLLFDRMVAFHVQRGVTVPLSAAEFYAGLEQRFPPRDGMYFLPDQAAEYDKKRMTVKEVLQLQLFVSDEASAIQWLKQQLTKKPQTFQDIHPQFLKKIGGWQKHEKALELSELLEQNFLRYDGRGEVSSQIHSYLSTNFKELRNLPKNDESLRAKAKDRWYVSDPNKAGDLEKLRERALMREFEEYRKSKQKRLKVFRLEAVRAGLKKAWQERDYGTIISMARKIPEKILQEDPKLLMWYDQAITRTGGD
jgi:DNA modification methylase/predicted RNA-binding Zn-ribbon protein involved in translation (DUF1610 family)